MLMSNMPLVTISLHFNACSPSIVLTARVLLETEKGEKIITLFRDQLQALTSNAAGYSISDKLLGIDRVKIAINNSNAALTATVL